MSDQLEQEEQRVCRNCGRPLIEYAGTWMHATPWRRIEGSDEGQREIYRHCRVQIAVPWETSEGVPPADDVEREEAVNAYFSGTDTDWQHPDDLTRAGLAAFRAGWRAARG